MKVLVSNHILESSPPFICTLLYFTFNNAHILKCLFTQRFVHNVVQWFNVSNKSIFKSSCAEHLFGMMINPSNQFKSDLQPTIRVKTLRDTCQILGEK